MTSYSYPNHGWRRNAVCFALGVLATLALPPFFILPLVVPAFSGLLLLLIAAPTTKRAFLDGWWWGWGFYISGLYWFCIALLTDAEKFAWMIPFALFALTGFIALFCGLACAVTKIIPLRGISTVFLFATAWLAAEWTRGHILSGFPWNLQGYSLAASDATLQLAWLVGIYGMTWWIVLLASSLATFYLPGIKRPHAYAFIGILWFIALGFVGWGEWRLAHYGNIPSVEGVKLRLVQANIAQHHKWDPKRQLQGLQKHMHLTQSPGLEGITHVIWPETAIPYIIQNNSRLTQYVGLAIGETQYLISGALRLEGEEEAQKIFNSALMLDHSGNILGYYDKAKRVPFGEFLPFRSVIPASWLTPVGMRDLDPGPGPQTLSWPGLPEVSPLICYEVIFPELTVATHIQPDWLLTITNDAWFGMSSGPYQHFTMARVRAVEHGLPMVRVANTGISGVIDPLGRVLAQLPLNSEGVLDVNLPQKLQ